MLTLVFQRQTVQRALIIALLVGCILNLINQGDRLFAGELGHIDWVKALITYFVPYCVATYSSVSAQLRFAPGSRAPFSAQLECKECEHEIEIKEGAVIPDCDHCGGRDWQQQNNQ